MGSTLTPSASRVARGPLPAGRGQPSSPDLARGEGGFPTGRPRVGDGCLPSWSGADPGQTRESVAEKHDVADLEIDASVVRGDDEPVARVGRGVRERIAEGLESVEEGLVGLRVERDP